MFGDVTDDGELVLDNARDIVCQLLDRPLSEIRLETQDCTELTAIIASWWSEFLEPAVLQCGHEPLQAEANSFWQQLKLDMPNTVHAVQQFVQQKADGTQAAQDAKAAWCQALLEHYPLHHMSLQCQ